MKLAVLREDVRGRIQLVLVLVIFTGLQVLFTMHLRMGSLPASEPAPEKVEEFNPHLYQVMSFGQLPAVVDWFWLKTLQDPILTHVTRGNHPAIFYTLDLVTELDPKFTYAYSIGATLVSVIRDDGPGALHLALKGLKFQHEELPKYSEEFRERYWQAEWSIPVLLGYIYLFDMEDISGAAKAFTEAAQIPGAPGYLPLLAKQFSEPDGLYKVGIRVLGHMIDGSSDPDVKRRLNQKREWLQVNQFLHHLNRQFQEFASKRPELKKKGFTWESRGADLFSAFRAQSHLSAHDPWDGEISLADGGKIVTTTPHQKVLGLE